MRKIDGSRSISSTIASRSASRNDRTRGSGIHVLPDGGGVGYGGPLREIDGILDLRLRLVVEGVELLLRRDAELLDALGEDADRIALHPLLELLLAAILPRVGHRVPAKAVRLGLDEERLALAACPVDGVAHRLAHLQHV